MIQILERNKENQIGMTIPSKMLEERIVFIDDEINDYTAISIQQQLLYLKSLSNDPISIYINSPGGSVYDGLIICDTINILNNSGIIVKTINLGKAMSMAAIILLCGTNGYRSALPNSTIMLHELSTYVGDIKYGDLEVKTKECGRLMGVIEYLIRFNSDYFDKYKLNNGDVYLTADDALKVNIIDNIITSF